MFGDRSKESSTVSEYIEKKSKLIRKKNKIFKLKINQIIRGEHQHYFSKNDVAARNQNAQCKVCGMLLSEFRVQRRIENWTPNLKPIHKTHKLTDNDLEKEVITDASST